MLLTKFGKSNGAHEIKFIVGWVCPGLIPKEVRVIHSSYPGYRIIVCKYLYIISESQ